MTYCCVCALRNNSLINVTTGPDLISRRRVAHDKCCGCPLACACVCVCLAFATWFATLFLHYSPGAHSARASTRRGVKGGGGRASRLQFHPSTSATRYSSGELSSLFSARGKTRITRLSDAAFVDKGDVGGRGGGAKTARGELNGRKKQKLTTLDSYILLLPLYHYCLPLRSGFFYFFFCSLHKSL